MAALQMTVSGTAQDVDNLIITQHPVHSTNFLQGATFFGNNVTNLVAVDRPEVGPGFLQIDGGKFFEENTTRLVIVEGFGHSPSTGGGGASEPVSKESWE